MKHIVDLFIYVNIRKKKEKTKSYEMYNKK